MAYMDLNALTALVISKFKEAGGYSELNDQQLFKSIYKYLDMVYFKHFSIAQKKIENDEKQGMFISPAVYKKEYDLVEDVVMAHANRIAAIDRSEI